MTQKQRILNHLKSGRTLTQLEAFNRIGCCRLSERVRELRADGHKIGGYMARVRTRDGFTHAKKYYLGKRT